MGFARAVRDFGPDLIHTHGSQASGVARLARPRNPRVPVVFSPHNFAFTNWFSSAAERRAYRLIERLLMPLTSRYVAVCEAELRQVRAIGGGRRGRLVYNGITPFDPGPPGRRYLELGAGGPILAAVTELQPPKGIPTLIEAMPAILAAAPGAKLLIAGDGPMRAEVEALIASLGVGGSVVLLGDVGDVPALLAAADVFLAPGWAESFPYANLEAMSARLPIVAADSGGVGEAIVDGRDRAARPRARRRRPGRREPRAARRPRPRDRARPRRSGAARGALHLRGDGLGDPRRLRGARRPMTPGRSASPTSSPGSRSAAPR